MDSTETDIKYLFGFGYQKMFRYTTQDRKVGESYSVSESSAKISSTSGEIHEKFSNMNLIIRLNEEKSCHIQNKINLNQFPCHNRNEFRF